MRFDERDETGTDYERQHPKFETAAVVPASTAEARQEASWPSGCEKGSHIALSATPIRRWLTRARQCGRLHVNQEALMFFVGLRPQ